MSLNKKSVDDINVKGKRVLCRCDFNVPLKEGKSQMKTVWLQRFPLSKADRRRRKGYPLLPSWKA